MLTSASSFSFDFETETIQIRDIVFPIAFGNTSWYRRFGNFSVFLGCFLDSGIVVVFSKKSFTDSSLTVRKGDIFITSTWLPLTFLGHPPNVIERREQREFYSKVLTLRLSHKNTHYYTRFTFFVADSRWILCVGYCNVILPNCTSVRSFVKPLSFSFLCNALRIICNCTLCTVPACIL